MAGGSPRIVTADLTITWDRVQQRLTRGQVLDVQPGSPLEEAIGAGNLRPLGPISHPAEEDEAAQDEAPAGGRRARGSKASDDSSDSKDGDAS